MDSMYEAPFSARRIALAQAPEIPDVVIDNDLEHARQDEDEIEVSSSADEDFRDAANMSSSTSLATNSTE